MCLRFSILNLCNQGWDVGDPIGIDQCLALGADGHLRQWKWNGRRHAQKWKKRKKGDRELDLHPGLTISDVGSWLESTNCGLPIYATDEECSFLIARRHLPYPGLSEGIYVGMFSARKLGQRPIFRMSITAVMTCFARP